MLRARRNRQAVTALTVSATGTAMADSWFYTVVPLVMLRVTTDPFTISLPRAIGLAIPMLAYPLGKLADAGHQRRILHISTLSRTILSVGLAAVAGYAPRGAVIPLIIAVVVGFTLSEVASDVVYSPLLRQHASDDELGKVNSRIRVLGQVGQTFVTRPLSTLAFSASAVWGIVAAGALSGVSWLSSFFVPKAPEPEEATTAVESTPALRFRQVIALPEVYKLIIPQLLAIGGLQLAQGSLAYFAIHARHMSEAGFGTLVALASGGGIVGSLVAGWLPSRLYPRLLGISVALLGVTIGCTGFTPDAARLPGVVIFAVLQVLGGLAGGIYNVIFMTIRQFTISRELLARASALTLMSLGVVSPLAVLASGWISRADARLPWFIGAVMIVAAIVFVARIPMRPTATATVAAD